MSTQRKYSIFILPALFILVLFFVEWIEHTYGMRFAKYGVLPRTLEGLKGVLLSPFIHSDWKHLTNNALPLFVLTWVRRIRPSVARLKALCCKGDLSKAS